MNNFKLNFALVAHSAPRTFKKGTPEERTTVPCLFVRTVDKDLGEQMNVDSTYPHCDALSVALSPELFEQVKAFKDIPFICDSMAAGKYDEKIFARKIKIGNSFISLKAEDVIDNISTAEAVPDPKK